jgi:hypothetical protein
VPLAHITYNPNTITSDILDRLRDVLPSVASQALSTGKKDGYVGPKDIMLRFYQLGRWDRNNHDVNVEVFAHDFPERRGDLARRRELISVPVYALLPEGRTGHVWVWLGKTDYAGFTKE